MTTDRVSIVTGATKGIGRATALALDRAGWTVVVTGRDEGAGGELAHELTDGCFIAADLRDAEAPDRLVDEVVGRHGRLDGLVNCAGVHRLATIVETDPATWDHVLGVNLRAAYLVCRSAIPHLAASGAGVIVNVASEAGLAAIPGQVAYNVSKAGMVMLTRSIAVDHAVDGIRAVSVCPGATLTPLVEASLAEADDPAAQRRHLEQVRPANRLGTVDEIAAAIVFAMRSDVSYFTGSELVIDGGFTAG